MRSFGELYAATETALNPQGGGIGAYSPSNLIKLMQRSNLGNDPYKLYNNLVENGKIARGTKIKNAESLISTYSSSYLTSQYETELKALYAYLSTN